MQRLMYPDKNLLQCVLCFSSVTQHQVGRLVDQILVLLEEDGESLFITGLTAADQVHLFSSHWRSLFI